MRRRILIEEGQRFGRLVVVLVTVDGKRYTLAEYARENGLPYMRVFKMFRRRASC